MVSSLWQVIGMAAHLCGIIKVAKNQKSFKCHMVNISKIVCVFCSCVRKLMTKKKLILIVFKGPGKSSSPNEIEKGICSPILKLEWYSGKEG